jgi:hypothetical protein
MECLSKLKITIKNANLSFPILRERGGKRREGKDINREIEG